MNNPTRRRPPSPDGVKSTSDMKTWATELYTDLYPKIQGYDPQPSGVSNATATLSTMRSGRIWVFSVTFTPIVPATPMISTGGTFRLPFNSFANANFLARVDGAPLAAWVAANANTVFLPNFTTSLAFTISGTAGE